MECVRHLRAGESGEGERCRWSAGGHRRGRIAREWVWRLQGHTGLATRFRHAAPRGGTVSASSALGQSHAQRAGDRDQQRPRAESVTRVPAPYVRPHGDPVMRVVDRR